MPSERSLYRKIQLVLELSDGASADSSHELASAIRHKNVATFNTLQYSDEKDEFSWKQSQSVIRRTIRFCQRLKLLDDLGRITAIGRQALRQTQFDKVLSRQVRACLEESGVNIKHFKMVIREGLRSVPPVLPTPQELWLRSDSDIKVGDFVRLITLLANTGAATSSQKKIFLDFE